MEFGPEQTDNAKDAKSNIITINEGTSAEIIESERLGRAFRNVKIKQQQGEGVFGIVELGEDELRYLTRSISRPKKSNKKVEQG